ncbi:MAG: acetylornithine transaminase [Bacillaceae bacterium]
MKSSLFHNYSRREIEIVKGKGAMVWDQNGKEYLDFIAGIAVCNLGHCHDDVVEAVEKQLHTLWHTSNLFQNSLQEEVAQMLTNNCCGNYVFFCNSGTEANEAAIKLARKYTGKEKMITFQHSFHGRTFAAMSATGQEKVKAGFGSMVQEFVHLPFNDVLSFEEEMDETVSAVLLEVIQGEGGVNIGQKPFLKAVEAACKKYGALLIVDEVQTGIGRTGKPFGYQHFDIEPDIITVAKGLGNGFPVGAIIGKEHLFDTFNPGSHGSTFGGNKLAMSAAKAVLQHVFEPEFLKDVKQLGDFYINALKEALKDVEQVANIRGKGLILGIECDAPVHEIILEAEKNGLLLVSAGTNVIRLLPPLNVTKEQLEKSIEVIKASILHVGCNV